MLLFCKNIFPERTSGVVIAGFGEKDIFPKLRSFECESIVCNKIKKSQVVHSEIEFNNISAIIPFAQQEMVHMFMRGIDPILRLFQNQYLEQIFQKFPDILIERIKDLSNSEKKDLKKILLKSSQKLYNDFKDNIENFSQKNFVNAVISVVDMLPKDEMAIMAETFVNLTLFKQRVSLETETVGGPIDVAVITKGDGFVWIKRKFYFDKNINPRYLQT